LFPLLSPPDSRGRLAYKYTSPFGNRTHPVTGEIESFHNGQDLGVPSNTPILAVEDGRIDSLKYAGPNNSEGNRIHLISTDGNRKFAYLHLNGFKVKAGELVKKGQIIGMTGNTGRSTGPHLHFSFYDMLHQEWIDPSPVVRFWEKNMDWEAFKLLNGGAKTNP